MWKIKHDLIRTNALAAWPHIYSSSLLILFFSFFLLHHSSPHSKATTPTSAATSVFLIATFLLARVRFDPQFDHDNIFARGKDLLLPFACCFLLSSGTDRLIEITSTSTNIPRLVSIYCALPP
jgi:hypothetical protein